EHEKSQVPVVTIFSEQKGDDNYMLLMVMPPQQQKQEPLARETVFILDTSGSMGGESIRQAKKALLMAVARMRPEDRFNVIEFNSMTRSIFSASRPGSSDNLQKAYSFIDQLEARGGTEIKPALEQALDGRHDHERIRQVVFLTDACVSNEEELFTLINNRLGDSRLFTVGIGSSPNSYFMTRAAAMGKGSYTFIGKLDEVREKMTALFTMLEQPAITDLVLSGGEIVESLPSPLPDLYQGEPMIAVLKSRWPVQDLKLSGLKAGRTPWQVNVDTGEFTDRTGIGVLWARKKIRILMDSLAAGADPEKVKKEVAELALQNHLVSRYTSLVAVEQKISRPGNTPLNKKRLKTNLPAGWQYDKVFAGNAATATPAALFLLMGLFLFIMAGMLAGLKRKK
ncbi:MAG: VWA domain-containing protein, partial [Thermodesulfobacteriota bacterium]|nr:VWA domain-containing protein [Thermodesulfobacteriota bacterium]